MNIHPSAGPTAPEKILVIKLGALGDFIQALGPMAAIRRHHPHADITLLTTAPFLSFGRDCGLFNHIWIDERPRWTQPARWLALRRRLTAGGFSRIYDLQNNDRTALYLRLFPRSARPEWVGAAPGASHRNAAPERTAGQALQGHVQTLALAGIHDVGPDDLSWVQADISLFGLAEEPYVLLVPGSSPAHPEKRWPAAHYGELARVLDGWGYLPVILGTTAEQEAAATIARIHPNVRDLTGQTSLFDIVMLARGARAAIGNDTGPMHLIAPTGCPSWLIFSRHTNPQRHAAQGPQTTIISHPDLSALSVDDVTAQMNVRQFRPRQSRSTAII